MLPRSTSFSALLALALAPQLLLPALHTAQSQKLNGPLARPLGGDLLGFEVSPDGSRVVYLADQRTDGVFELFVTKPGSGAPPLLLAGPEAPAGDVHRFWIGPQGRHVFLTGSLLAFGVSELFVVPIDGGPRLRLSGSMVPGGGVSGADQAVQIAPDESRVFYLADQDQNNVTELYSVPSGGGVPLKLNDAIPGQQIRSFQLSPDGTKVVYRAFQATTGTHALHVVPSGGGRPIQLGPEGRDVSADFLIDATGERAVFSARTGVGNARQLHSRRMDGSGAPLPLLPAGLGSITQLRSSPDGARVVCVLGASNQASVASVALDGSGFITLDSLPGGFVFPSLALAPDGLTVVYVAGLPGGPSRLRRAAIDGSLTAADVDLTNGGSFALSPDGASVVYQGAGLSSARLDLSTPPVELAPWAHGRFAFSPGGERVVFAGGDLAFGAPVELYSVPAMGGKAPTRLNPPLVYGGNVDTSTALGFRVGALGNVVYVADQIEDESRELFSVPLAGGTALRLSADMPPGPVEGDVLEHVLGARGEHAVYLADDLQNDRPELLSVRTDGTSEPIRLHGPLEDGELITEFAATPDGATVVYWVSGATLARDLWAVPVTGGPTLRLFGPGQAGSLIAIDPTSTRVLFSISSGGTSALMSVGLDGQALVQLDEGSLFSAIRFTPDGARALYPKTEGGLFSVPTGGGTGAVRIDGGGHLMASSHLVAPDGLHALYAADSLTSGQFEAFVAPLDGGSAPRRLNPPLPAGADVTRLAVAGGHAYYLADQVSPDQRELYRVPLDGSATAVKLNAPLVPGGNVTSFAVTPDGARVVYHADQELDERFELYGAPSDGSGPVVKLNPPVGSGDVGGDGFFDDPLKDVFLLSSDGTQVAFRADATRQGARELFVAPVDGSSPAVRVSRPASTGDTVLAGYRFVPGRAGLVFLAAEGWLEGGRDVSAFHAPAGALHGARRVGSGSLAGLPRRPLTPQLSPLPSGLRLVYRLDVETDGVTELFSAPLLRALPVGGAPTVKVVRSL